MLPVTWMAATDRVRGKLCAGMTFLERAERSEALEPWNLSGDHRTPAFAREKLPPGFAMAGPVIIEEKTSTVVAEPGWRMAVDDGGNLLLHGGARP
jgi:N-methylhydantoinase A/oxoprolinase/acetone carboxylase beta subunit